MNRGTHNPFDALVMRASVIEAELERLRDALGLIYAILGAEALQTAEKIDEIQSVMDRVVGA
jgi:hypothetical protein